MPRAVAPRATHAGRSLEVPPVSGRPRLPARVTFLGNGSMRGNRGPGLTLGRRPRHMQDLV